MSAEIAQHNRADLAQRLVASRNVNECCEVADVDEPFTDCM